MCGIVTLSNFCLAVFIALGTISLFVNSSGKPSNRSEYVKSWYISFKVITRPEFKVILLDLGGSEG